MEEELVEPGCEEDELSVSDVVVRDRDDDVWLVLWLVVVAGTDVGVVVVGTSVGVLVDSELEVVRVGTSVDVRVDSELVVVKVGTLVDVLVDSELVVVGVGTSVDVPVDLELVVVGVGTLVGTPVGVSAGEEVEVCGSSGISLLSTAPRASPIILRGFPPKM